MKNALTALASIAKVSHLTDGRVDWEATVEALRSKIDPQVEEIISHDAVVEEKVKSIYDRSPSGTFFKEPELVFTIAFELAGDDTRMRKEWQNHVQDYIDRAKLAGLFASKPGPGGGLSRVG
jgi:hypothetical protein